MIRSSVLVLACVLALAGCNSDEQVEPQSVPGSAVLGPDGQPLGADQAGISGGAIDSQSLQQQLAVEAGDRVLFETDQFELPADAQAVLQKQAAFLQAHPAVTASIEGHADERGTREYNLALGDRRANSIRNYLVALGVDGGRLSAISYGKERPDCAESSDACWAQNRRGMTVITQ
jgi:peptidoglycan-associated lipoprotein